MPRRAPLEVDKSNGARQKLESMGRLKLGELLLEAKAIDAEQLKAAIAEQQRRGGKLGDVLVRLGAISEEMLVEALGRQLELPWIHLDEVQELPRELTARLPLKVAVECLAVPLSLDALDRALIVAMAEPQSLRALETLRKATGLRIVPRLAGREAVRRALERLYPSAG